MIAAALVLFAAVAIGAVFAVADWWSQAGRDLDRMVVDALDPIPPAPPWVPDYQANIDAKWVG
jgi:ABC-type nitrate/sulfonate/bicarbonate transport system permease component